MASADVIAAIATAPGQAGIGVIRVSGPHLQEFACHLTAGGVPVARQARFTRFTDAEGNVMDEGLLIYFQAPSSFTGEDVLELQAHGGNAVLRLLLARCLQLGARMALPGEFTQRAFFNHKIDLAQAEAVADLIAAESTAAVKGAARSLTGQFSRRVNALVDDLVALRMGVEGSIDFAEEGVDFMAGDFPQRLGRIRMDLASLLEQANQGTLLRSGRRVVLIGAPNVGKSSLLNALTEEEHALVTNVPGTTRDIIRATVFIEGIPFHMLDTAGIRDTGDVVEQAGIERTWKAVHEADLAWVVADIRQGLTEADRMLLQRLPETLPRQVIYNKADLADPATLQERGPGVSAVTGAGLELLRQQMLELAGWKESPEPLFLARERHCAALLQAEACLERAQTQKDAVEFLAEELRLAQQFLSGITGSFSSDDLLGQIFSRFCIGK